MRARSTQSLQWAEQALAADPGDAENYAHLGLLRMRQGRYADAAELLVRAVENKPDHPGYLRRLADIMAHLGRGDDAVALARRAASLGRMTSTAITSSPAFSSATAISTARKRRS